MRRRQTARAHRSERSCCRRSERNPCRAHGTGSPDARRCEPVPGLAPRRPNTEMTPTRNCRRRGSRSRPDRRRIALPQKGGTKIFGHGNLVIRRRLASSPGPEASGVPRRCDAFHPLSESTSPPPSQDRGPRQNIREFGEGNSSPPARLYEPIDIGRVENRFRIKASEIAAPDYWGCDGWRALTAFDNGTGACKLRSRHHGECDRTAHGIVRMAFALRDVAVYARQRIDIRQIAVDDFQQFSPAGSPTTPIAITESGKRLLAGRVARGLTQKDHEAPRSTRSKNATACAQPFSPASKGRSSYQSG